MASVRGMGNATKPAKLRNSCDACSIAKVKCNKEKPSCTRCLKRDQSCVYGTSKRSGRPLRNASENDRTSTAGTSTVSSTSPTASTVDLLEMSNPFSSAPLMDTTLLPAVAQNTPSSTQPWSGACSSLPPVAENSTDILGPRSDMDLDQLFPMIDGFSSFHGPDWYLGDDSIPNLEHCGLPNYGVIGDDLGFHNDMTSCHEHSINLSSGSSIGDGPNPHFLPTPSLSHTRSASIQSSLDNSTSRIDRHESIDLSMLTTANNPLLDGGSSTSQPSCQCLARALDNLAQLSNPPSRSSISAGDAALSPELLKLDRIIVQNDARSADITEILQCACTCNGYLLVLLSLSIFKITAWYTAAANAGRAHPHLSSSNHSNGSHALGFKDQSNSYPRTAAQAILPKLTGVQLLIDRVSQRIATAETTTQQTTSIPDEYGPEALNAALEGRMFAQPFSTKMLRSLEMDMRDRLQALSRVILGTLKH